MVPVRDIQHLQDTLRRIDGRQYKAYRDLAGAWTFGDFDLHVDHVQGDPFAAPSKVHVTVRPAVAGLPSDCLHTGARREGAASALARRFAEAAGRASRVLGSGKSGTVRMTAPPQQVLPQTAVILKPDGLVEARFAVGLPARGRTVLGPEAASLLLNTVPDLVRTNLVEGAYDPHEVARWAGTNEDADHLRGLLPDLGLVAFVADGSVLPRVSGVDDGPLDAEGAVPIASPESLRVDVELPNFGRVSGMGIREGVTLIVGGGYHGKSTLLRALELGVYNHRPGDGRERVVAVRNAVKVRSEDGRSVTGVDITGFIDNLPMGRSTAFFSTPNASGSTSQAANIVEALEAGSRVLLVDEDSSATNFLIRDRRMQALVPKSQEPINPFIDRVEALRDSHGVSSVLVLGGSGDYLEVADTVIAMRDYLPVDVTEESRRVAREHPTGRQREEMPPLDLPALRTPDMRSVDPSRGNRKVSIRVPNPWTVLFGSNELDLSSLDQLVVWGQANAIAHCMLLAARSFDGRRATMAEVLDHVEATLAAEGLDALDRRRPGDLVGFRRHELAAALNRLRSLRVYRSL